LRIALSALIVLVLIAATAFAADMYSVNSGATAQIDEHGVCQRITNSHGSGLPIMVPTRTAMEWATFRNNRPAGVTMAACPPVCSGASAGGYCFYAGAGGQSCTQVCSARGGVNIAGTRNYVGSGGTFENCRNIASALSLTTNSGGDSNSCSQGIEYLGCGEYSSFLGVRVVRCTNAATNADGATTGFRRVCACNN